MGVDKIVVKVELDTSKARAELREIGYLIRKLEQRIERALRKAKRGNLRG